MMIFYFVLAFFVQEVVPADIIVTLPNGKIEGMVSKTYRHGNTFYAFMGIPFAAPPVGNLRFQPPQPVKNWNGVLPTKALKKTCYQVQRKASTESEDCLYLEVFTPVKPGSSPSLPVIVNFFAGAFIHGNAFTGTGQAHNLLEKGIVVVSLNYRIGPFGFLSTGDTVIPGNMGLKDQQFALKWVQQNIHLFGGDPKKVTIMGQSAGSASVSYHMLSPGSAGLFRAAIAHSSSALSSYAYESNPSNVAYGIAAEIDHTFTRKHSTKELLNFLLKVPASAIVATGAKFGKFSPVIEVSHPGAFITKPMHEMTKEGLINKVPLFIGYASEEEISQLADLPSWKNSVKRMIPQNLVEPGMNLKDRSKSSLVGEKIKDIYTNATFEQHLGKAVQYYSDIVFIRSIIRFAELASQHTDVYFYQFSFQGKISHNGLSYEGVSGVAHGEDMPYIWTHVTSKHPEADVKTLDRYVGLVTNFAKYLNPIPKKDALFNVILPKMTHNNMYYLDIRKDLEVKKNPRQFSYQKWVQLFEEYGKQPFTTF